VPRGFIVAITIARAFFVVTLPATFGGLLLVLVLVLVLMLLVLLLLLLVLLVSLLLVHHLLVHLILVHLILVHLILLLLVLVLLALIINLRESIAMEFQRTRIVSIPIKQVVLFCL
jgi:hypothetical protein